MGTDVTTTPSSVSQGRTRTSASEGSARCSSTSPKRTASKARVKSSATSTSSRRAAKTGRRPRGRGRVLRVRLDAHEALGPPRAQSRRGGSPRAPHVEHGRRADRHLRRQVLARGGVHRPVAMQIGARVDRAAPRAAPPPRPRPRAGAKAEDPPAPSGGSHRRVSTEPPAAEEARRTPPRNPRPRRAASASGTRRAGRSAPRERAPRWKPGARSRDPAVPRARRRAVARPRKQVRLGIGLDENDLAVPRGVGDDRIAAGVSVRSLAGSARAYRRTSRQAQAASAAKRGTPPTTRSKAGRLRPSRRASRWPRPRRCRSPRYHVCRRAGAAHG